MELLKRDVTLDNYRTSECRQGMFEALLNIATHLAHNTFSYVMQRLLINSYPR